MRHFLKGDQRRTRGGRVHFLGVRREKLESERRLGERLYRLTTRIPVSQEEDRVRT